MTLILSRMEPTAERPKSEFILYFVCKIPSCFHYVIVQYPRQVIDVNENRADLDINKLNEPSEEILATSTKMIHHILV